MIWKRELAKPGATQTDVADKVLESVRAWRSEPQWLTAKCEATASQASG